MASLKELLKDIESPAPSGYDPEIDEADETLAKVTKASENSLQDDNLKLTPTVFGSLRARVDHKLKDDPRYQGEKVDRRDILDESDEDLSGDETLPENAREMFKKHFESIQLDDNEEESEEEEGSGEEKEMDDESGDEDDFGDSDDSEVKRGIKFDDMRSDDEDESPDEGEDDQEMGQERIYKEDDEVDFNQLTSETVQKRIEEEKERGEAVKKQISLWDKCLEYRIRMQKVLLKCNQLPSYDTFPSFKKAGGSELSASLSETYSALVELLNRLLVLQSMLIQSNPETRKLFKAGKEKKRSKRKETEGDEEEDIDSDDEDIPSDIEDNAAGENPDKEESDIEDDVSEEEEDSEEEENSGDEDSSKNVAKKKSLKRKSTLSLDEYEEEIAKRYKALNTFRDSVIQKWHDKTRLSSGKINSKSFSAFDRSPLLQIKQVLSDKERLIKRTQLQRSSYHILGSHDEEKPSEQENPEDMADIHLKNYHPEIFDDGDFYHQLLKELIERKSNVSSDDPIAMGRQWLEVQKLRTKMKRKVDTKASKGRKIRYNTHAKLVSFMAPVEVGSMPHENRTELFSTLFGKKRYEYPNR